MAGPAMVLDRVLDSEKWHSYAVFRGKGTEFSRVRCFCKRKKAEAGSRTGLRLPQRRVMIQHWPGGDRGSQEERGVVSLEKEKGKRQWA